MAFLAIAFADFSLVLVGFWERGNVTGRNCGIDLMLASALTFTVARGGMVRVRGERLMVQGW